MVAGRYVSHPDRFGDITWGAVEESTDAFQANACEELWFVITRDHAAHPGFRAGFDLAGYAKAFRSLTGRPFPRIR